MKRSTRLPRLRCAWLPVPVFGLALLGGPASAQNVINVQVETGVAGFVGVVPDGIGGGIRVPRPGRPVEVRSWTDFTSRFGQAPLSSLLGAGRPDGEAYAYLLEAVRGFFSNGGTRAWVVRAPGLKELDDLDDELRALAGVDVDLILVPGVTGRQQHEAVLRHVEAMGDRVALLDGRPDASGSRIRDVRATARNSSRASLIYPWVVPAGTRRGGQLAVPGSGHVAGAIARQDRERGVHRTPAPLDLARVAGPARTLSQAAVANLSREGVLVLRTASGSTGAQTWGGRTLGGDANGEFRYLAVRRLIDHLTETLQERVDFTVCAGAAVSAESILETAWRAGALQGPKASDAYFARCDRDGRLVVGVAPVRPAEFVVLDLQ